MNYKKSVALLRQHKLATGIDQDALGSRMGLSAPTVSRILSGVGKKPWKSTKAKVVAYVDTLKPINTVDAPPLIKETPTFNQYNISKDLADSVRATSNFAHDLERKQMRFAFIMSAFAAVVIAWASILTMKVV